MLNQLTVTGLKKKIGFKTILEDIDLTVEAGELLVITGPNGAGKTTLLRILAGLNPLSAGEVRWDGELFAPKNVEHLKQIGILGHRPMVYGSLTALENLMFFSKMYGVKGSKVRIEEMLRWVGLIHYKHERVETFSRGMQQRLALARMLMHAPALLLYDEPFTGLDAEGQRLLTGTLKAMQDEGRVQVLITHNLDELRGLNYRQVRLVGGRIVYGSEDELAASQVFDDVGLPAFARITQGLPGSRATKKVDMNAEVHVSRPDTDAEVRVSKVASLDEQVHTTKVTGIEVDGHIANVSGQDIDRATGVAANVRTAMETGSDTGVQAARVPGYDADNRVSKTMGLDPNEPELAGDDEMDEPLDITIASEAWRLACDKAEQLSVEETSQEMTGSNAGQVLKSVGERLKGLFTNIKRSFIPDLAVNETDSLPEGGITVEEFLKSQVDEPQTEDSARIVKSTSKVESGRTDANTGPRLHENAVITSRFTGNPFQKRGSTAKVRKGKRSSKKTTEVSDRSGGKRDKS